MDLDQTNQTPPPEEPQAQPEPQETSQEAPVSEIDELLSVMSSKPAAPELKAVPGGKKKPEATPAPTPAPAAPPKPDELALLREQVAALQNQIRQSQTQTPVQPQAPQPQASPYQVQVPSQLVQAFTSGDPAQVGPAIQQLIHGMGNLVESTIMEKFNKEVLPGVTRQFQGDLAMRETIKSIESDFYGANPDLNHPAIRPIAQQVANQFVAANPNLQWSALVRDHIATQVREYLGQLRAPQPGAGQPQAGMSPPVAPVRRGPVMTPLGTRPNAGSLGIPTVADEAAELFASGR